MQINGEVRANGHVRPTVCAPSSLRDDGPLRLPSQLLMGPGPCNMSPRVSSALALQPLLPLCSELSAIMEDIRDGIRYAFQTRNPWTFAISGSGTAALETAICNLLERGERMLAATHGYWGTTATEMCVRHGVTAFTVSVPVGQVFTLEKLEEHLRRHRPHVLYICQGDSTTGILQPLEDLGHLCHAYDCLLLVDGVASVGAAPLYADAWDIDVVFSAAQKCLGGPPGLSVISFNERAMKKIDGRSTPVDCYYLDAKLIGRYWGCQGEPPTATCYHHTPPSNLLLALREALATLARETLEKSWERHAACADLFAEGVRKLGFDVLVRDRHRLPSVVVVKPPVDVCCDDALRRLKSEWSLVMTRGSFGQHEQREVWRVGIMGYNATRDNVEYVLRALADATRLRTKGDRAALL